MDCSLRVIGICISLILCASTANAASFTPLGGATTTSGRGISADGQIVTGIVNAGEGGNPEAFIFEGRGESGPPLRTIGERQGARSILSPRALSGDGSTIVGDRVGDSIREAFVWTEVEGVRGLGNLGGLAFSLAIDVSFDGSTVVGFASSDLGREAFVWNDVDGMRGLGREGLGAIAHGVSDDGSVVVGTLNSAGEAEAFIWTAESGIQGLGDLPGGLLMSTAATISGDGSAVVGTSESDQGAEAFIWTAEGGMQGLGDLPGGAVHSRAFDVSRDGSIVVGLSHSASGNSAFVWDSANGMQSLQVLLTSLGLDVSGWRLSEITDVSADGKTFLGNGINPSGNAQAFIATIPEPSTALLIALGLLTLGFREKA